MSQSHPPSSTTDRRRPRRRAGILALGLIVAATVGLSASPSSAASSKGTLKVKLAAPYPATATAVVKGGGKVLHIAKKAGVGGPLKAYKLKPGKYVVYAKVGTDGTNTYVPAKSKYVVKVLRGKTKYVVIKYTKVAPPAPTQPSDTVFGPGISLDAQSMDGTAQQWGHSDALSPGTPAWILSTGLMSSIPGTASNFASTDLGLPGSPELTALVGRDTHDAVAYNATVTPAGKTLHVRYLFASEEYPEYVGSQFNDVMAVYVNGTNCALIDGKPVSVNVINDTVHPELYVPNNNTKPTSMDGYTKALQCDVPVTPGQQTKVKIVVADTSDGIFDSAVGMLDKGIWSD